MQEIWKPVIGYEGLYEISNMGNVKGVRRSGCTGEPLKAHIDHNGYVNFSLTKDCKRKQCKGHRLVAMAFIPNPENKRTVNHKNGNKQDNRVENLEWMTYSENHKHAYRTGLKKVSDAQRKVASETGKRTCAINRLKKPVIMTDSTGSEMRFESAHAGARFVNGNASPIIRCCKKKKPTYKGCAWRYADGE